ncbi:MAG: UDP-N-acetylmuramoyl-L-alanyl-D-glutamate--2,6-diaminopimelate ligase [Actinomycetota bacterium]
MSATLSEVIDAVDGRPVGTAVDRALAITGATNDSRAVQPGWLYCCVPGANVDGHDFAPAAVDAGATALLVERPLDLDVAQVEVAYVRASMGPAAAAVEGHPSDALTVLGVTGTNGKSSVVQILADIWEKAGIRTDQFGTLTGARTTPEAPELQRRLRASSDTGTGAVAMEVSSHALDMYRVAGTQFAAVIFTNLSRDHLDYHGTMEAYFEAKSQLFTADYSPVAVVNVDDDYGVRLAASLLDRPGIDLHPYEMEHAEDLVIDGPRSHFVWRGRPVTLHLAGRHNVANALAAATTAAALGLDLDTIADALCATSPVRGRFEMIDVGQPFAVAIDYAHTPDALDAVLEAADQASAGRVIVVFGCGGDRDQDKRPMMGEVAQRRSDLAIVTTDNPRGEDPLAIIDDVLSGTTWTGGEAPGAASADVRVEPDRRAAIAAALAEARAGDIVVIAGKGHETVQEVGSCRTEFDDRQVALEELGALT